VQRLLAIFSTLHEICHYSFDLNPLSLSLLLHPWQPVKHGIVATPEMWPYSNYLDWIGKRDDTPIARCCIRDHFDSPEQYAVAVWEYLTESARLP
jgi:hypothetical protein